MREREEWVFIRHRAVDPGASVVSAYHPPPACGHGPIIALHVETTGDSRRASPSALFFSVCLLSSCPLPRVPPF